LHEKESVFSVLETFDYGLPGIPWEAVLLDDKVVELITEELGAQVASMAVVDTKEAALGPIFFLSVLGLRDVENNRHAVLIIVPNQSLISNSRISSYNSISLD